MRTINPHNDQILSGSLETGNRIVYQVPPDTAHRSVVSARGTMYNSSYLALGTNDVRGEAFITKHSPLADAVTLDYLYYQDTNYTFGYNDSISGNTSIGLVYDVGILNSGTNAILTFFYAFRPDMIDEALTHAASVGVKANEIITKTYQVFPNPATNFFRVSGLAPFDELVVYDMMGNKRGQFVNAVNHNEFSIEDYTTGNYIVLIRDRKGNVKGKVLMQKL